VSVVLSVRVADDLASRFDLVAAPGGGRSAMLHRLVRDAAAEATPGAAPRKPRRDALRLMVRLAPPEAAHVEREALAMAMPRAAWVAALVRRHVTGRSTFARADELTLIGTLRELRRIGVNVNQIARALNTAVMEGRVLDTELTAVDDLRRELRGHIGGLQEAFAGNLAYWAVEP
jgi:hypothetical protein